jgi:SH3-like domain-containing protein
MSSESDASMRNNAPSRQVFTFVLALAASLPCLASPAGAADEAVKPPYFESIKSDPVYMREGPSNEHKVKWVYHRKGLPVEVLAEFDVWRRVRDADGEIGWMHVAMLSRERTAVVQGSGTVAVRRDKEASAPVVAQAQPGAIGRVKSCTPEACELNFSGVGGWIARSSLWGLYDDEHL